MQSPTTISKPINELTNKSKTMKVFIIRKQLSKVSSKAVMKKSLNLKSSILIPKINNINASENANVVKKVPVLKITINKKYNKVHAPNIDINKCAPNVVNNSNVANKIEKNMVNEDTRPDLKDHV